jgi:integrase
LARDIARGLRQDTFDWAAFAAWYEREHLSGLSGKSREAWHTTYRWLAKTVRPRSIQDFTPAFVVRWQNAMRSAGLSQTSIDAYTARLRAALSWAVDMDVIREAPKIRKPKRGARKSKMARSRAVTAEEFDRILDAAEKVRPDDFARWQRFLRGLWHSGFRLEELLRLSWSPRAAWTFDTSGKIPCIRIRGAQKSQKDQLQPITPEFWQLCCETPPDEQKGPVFPLPGPNGQLSKKRAGKIISRIGKEARVVTDPATGKCATSHDIGRRAFTTRMEGTLSLAELQKWMRHASIDTTLTYYHHADAEALARKAWGRES